MDKSQIEELIEKQIKQISSYEQLVQLSNSRGCVDGKIIGTGRADYTLGSTVYNLSIFDRTFALIDVPGIEGDESQFEETIRESIDKAHTIFYVCGSGKKLEKATLEKVKKYMHDGTSVYAIFNVHCKAKKERINGIDKTYVEELKEAYVKQEEIIRQTEEELIAFLGNNYKGSIPINGLLAFCAHAVKSDGSTTIIYDKYKNLRSDQIKFLKEYDGNFDRLRNDSNIGAIQSVITDKVSNIDKEIYAENTKKLKNRLSEMITKIDCLKDNEIDKIHGFISVYNEFESNCYNAKEDFLQIVRHIGHNAASDAFLPVKEDLYQIIENDKGKTEAKKIQEYFKVNKEKIVNDIQDSINNRLTQAQADYEEAIEDARQRLLKDFEREEIKFEILLSTGSLDLDDSFASALKYNLKLFGKDSFRVGGLVISGAGVGTFIAPGLGTVVGAVVGALLGVFSSVWNFMASEVARINKAKEKLHRTIETHIDSVSNNIRKEIEKSDFEKMICESYEQICLQADKQKKALSDIEVLLGEISLDLKRSYMTVS